MKKTSKKQRERDIRLGLAVRQGKKRMNRQRKTSSSNTDWQYTNKWINENIQKGLQVNIKNNFKITLNLPEKMDFHENYDSTIIHISAIRKLTETNRASRKAYKLTAVNFDKLIKISTSAALVLTAELSKWDDTIRQRLRPAVDNWDNEILRQFTDLGFFDLFHNPPSKNIDNHNSSSVKLVKYIKGRCGDSKKTRILKEKLTNIVGDDISKWTFLRSGLDEAITNVSHHAYPDNHSFLEEDKNWYLTGSYNNETKEIKIVFYDQGIGIPKSLPTSEVWERILGILSTKIPRADRKKDEVLLKAAVQLDRTSTEETDRGKGLQDLLEFIRQRGAGYLSIISLKGLFKLSVNNDKETVKTKHFDNSICGTLIIWSAILAD